MVSPDPTPRWGIFGGAFDPIHSGHLQLARDCRAKRRLDRILFVPSYTPPHKPEGCVALFDQRCEMIQLAIDGEDHFELNRIEQEIGGEGYTLTLVRECKKRYPSVDFFFIIGADNIQQLKNWHQPEAIFREVAVLAGTRPGFELSDHGLPDAFTLDLVETTAVDVSATEIRDLLTSDQESAKLTTMIPAPVLAYIRERKLYLHG